MAEGRRKKEEGRRKTEVAINPHREIAMRERPNHLGAVAITPVSSSIAND
ncbi:MAG: hypothetical protein JGK26_19165 [Microcoleus sp. PH2017_27_LUM_O_A]|nr:MULTISPECIES: hypothetical protein [unclassified Microcoleus]MCC3459714.1 hypothetical protein [Microcoleus sp. PH2017_11_PCY_U_A]MCC3530154.1 hypothetical protein [Microcoleus sp. PH2017_21_RUC_O_A]MCC3542420.1 hypothetical protein [Microcoleus sp. PH2017_22_RUC_O_B]MCC3561216.1 hypothetical protein [Microcoleus sp. PH2017_27_LUM_O_A]